MSPQDRPKIAVLAVLILLAVGFFVRTLLKASADRAAMNAPAPAANQPATNPASGGGQPSGVGGQTAGSSVAMNTHSDPAVQGIDPFRTVFAKSTGSTAPGMRASEFTEDGIKPNGGVKLPDANHGGTAGGTGGTGGAGQPPFPVDPPAEAMIKVEGVIIDHRERVAVISVGGDTKFLGIGSVFGEFKVVGITPKSVVLQRKGERMTVEVGSTLGGPAFEPNVKIGSGV